MIQKDSVTYLAESLTYSLKVCNANKSPSNILQCHVDGELHLYLLEKRSPTSEQPGPENLSFTCTVVQQKNQVACQSKSSVI